MNRVFRDFRYALRALTHSPGFTLAAVVTLALGIGATTAMFTVVDGVLLKPLRYPDPDRIVAISTLFTDSGRAIPRLAGGDYVDLRQDRASFESIASYYGGEVGVQVAGVADFVPAVLAGTEFMNVFGVSPLNGRLFNADDAERSAIVGLSFATRHFGSGAGALGQALRLEDHVYTIVGVAPPSFQFPERTEVWVAAPGDPEAPARSAYNYRVVAKLRPGIGVEEVNSRLAVLGAQLASAYPDSNNKKSFLARPLREQLVAPVRTTLLVLMAAGGLVLLIACANVANLILARSTVRARAMSVFAALGATRWQIVRQSLAESLLLALAAGMLGVAIASACIKFLLVPDGVPLPRLADATIDWRVFLFAAGVCAIAAAAAGLAPALRAFRVNVADALKQAGTRGVVGSGLDVLRGGLVVAQIAASFVVVVGSGLLLRSFLLLMAVPLGFRTDATLVMYAHAPAQTLEDYVRVTRFESDLFARIRQLPGVVSVAGAMGMPAGQYGSHGGYAVEGAGTIEHHTGTLPQANFSLASPGYFSTIKIPLVRGRDFTDDDRYGREQVVIISEALARQSFSNLDPIGRRLQCGLDGESMKWMTIVGVVGDVRQDSPASDAAPAMYMPLAQHPFRANEVQVAIRTAIEPAQLIDPVTRVVREMNPDVAMKFTTMEAMLGESVAAARFRTRLAAFFAALSLVLAVMGVYSVMTFITAQRTGEFAVRTALGASPAVILRHVMGGALRLAAVGLVAGVALALAASRALAGMLFGVGSTDALTYLAVIALVVPAVVLGAGIPAMRASRVSPLTALRSE